jgi:tetratricopeptide (TPR) repeat protein
MIRYFLFFVLFLFLSINSFGQIHADPLVVAKKHIDNKEYSDATKILSDFLIINPENLEANWLYAIGLQYEYKYSESKKYFEKSIELAPNDINLMLGYARFCYMIGDFQTVNILNVRLLKNKDTELEALKMKANIEYWMGHYSKSISTLDLIKIINPTDPFISDLLEKINNEKSTNLRLNLEYGTDKQPLSETMEKLQIAKKLSFWLRPSFEFSNYNYSTSNGAQAFLLGNGFYFGKIGLNISTKAGFYNMNKLPNEIIYDFQIDQKVNKNFHLNFGMNSKPYVGTLSSTYMSLMQKNYFANLSYTHDKKITVNLLWNSQNFDDGNSVTTIGLWALTKPYNIDRFSFMLGYGFSYSDAKKNTFEPIYSIDSILANDDLLSSIQGVYNPYFTPERQIVNSAILVLQYDLSQKLKMGATINYSIYSTHRNPYFYLDSNFVQDVFFVKKYAKTTFTPKEIKAFITYKISNDMNFKVYYNFQETYYYSKHVFGLDLNYKF